MVTQDFVAMVQMRDHPSAEDGVLRGYWLSTVWSLLLGLFTMASSFLRMPFVVTITAAAAACGGTAVVTDGSGGAGGGGTSTSSTTDTSSSGTVSTAATGGIVCPDVAPSGFDQCDAAPGICSYDVACQSGTVAMQFSCEEGYWEFVPKACDLPYDSCPGTEYYCDDNWLLVEGTNPPAPCPETLPDDGLECTSGGMGGVWENCGYFCDDVPESGWVVASCVGEPGQQMSWQHEAGVCAP